jgi:hypothetical protein
MNEHAWNWPHKVSFFFFFAKNENLNWWKKLDEEEHEYNQLGLIVEVQRMIQVWYYLLSK